MKYPIPRPPRYLLRVRRSAAGLGLHAGEDMPKGRFLIEYWGRLVSDAQAQKVGGKYLFDLENGKAILGATRRNVARYANHACRPNAEIRVAGNRIFLFSIKRIKAGEEITYDYGEEYFNDIIKPNGCRCKTCVRKRKTSRKAKSLLSQQV